MLLAQVVLVKLYKKGIQKADPRAFSLPPFEVGTAGKEDHLFILNVSLTPYLIYKINTFGLKEKDYFTLI